MIFFSFEGVSGVFISSFCGQDAREAVVLTEVFGRSLFDACVLDSSFVELAFILHRLILGCFEFVSISGEVVFSEEGVVSEVEILLS